MAGKILQDFLLLAAVDWDVVMCFRLRLVYLNLVFYTGTGQPQQLISSEPYGTISQMIIQSIQFLLPTDSFILLLRSEFSGKSWHNFVAGLTCSHVLQWILATDQQIQDSRTEQSTLITAPHNPLTAPVSRVAAWSKQFNLTQFYHSPSNNEPEFSETCVSCVLLLIMMRIINLWITIKHFFSFLVSTFISTTIWPSHEHPVTVILPCNTKLAIWYWFNRPH